MPVAYILIKPKNKIVFKNINLELFCKIITKSNPRNWTKRDKNGTNNSYRLNFIGITGHKYEKRDNPLGIMLFKAFFTIKPQY